MSPVETAFQPSIVDDPHFGATGPKERPYLQLLWGILSDPERRRTTEARIAAKTKRFLRINADALRPGWAAAWASIAKTVLAIVTPLGWAWVLAMDGLWLPSLALVPLAGLALYGATSILHDTVHATFFPTRSANRWLGEILAPIFLLDFESFRVSHMGHHRDTQSVERDPKYPKLPWPNPSADATEATPRLAGAGKSFIAWPVVAWITAAKRIATLPPVVRHPFYVSSIVLLGCPVALAFGGEISLRQRDWRRPRPWRSLARSVLLYGGLLVVSPALFVLAVGAVWFALGCFFMIFLTHLSPYQVYPMRGRAPATKLFALNVSDFRLGLFTRMLGNRFSEYHAAHHLFPSVPSYRLERVGRWVDESLGDLKAPIIRPLTIEDGTFVGDGIVASVARPPEIALPQWDTPAGSFMRRTSARATPPSSTGAKTIAHGVGALQPSGTPVARIAIP